ncbi:Nitroreductase-like protein [Mariannaea sp. PMI_226]|nr:Nitroreductase-like protein [Mariannaea sp. PMI_226]
MRGEADVSFLYKTLFPLALPFLFLYQSSTYSSNTINQVFSLKTLIYIYLYKGIQSPPRTKETSSITLTQTTHPITMASKISADLLIQLAKNRRSVYALNKDITISTARITEIVKDITLQTPSSFNNQTNRIAVLFGAEHEKLWDITIEVLRAKVPSDRFAVTEQKLNGFRAAAGTVLFFQDQTVIDDSAAKFTSYADKFPHWATQSAAIQQYITWTALEAEGLGANLQHYNPIIDEKVQEAWKFPSNWKLDAQLVFGGKVAEAGEKAYQPLEERVQVFGA